VSIILENEGFCPICVSKTVFKSDHPWLRDNYFCIQCGSIPRERALMHVLESLFPAWKDMTIHETSPGNRGTSAKLARECVKYVPSHYFKDVPSGSVIGGIKSENLERLSFDDESIDIHVSQDVMEHVFSPEKAFAEIGRTLRKGGAHIFTVPIVNKYRPTIQRAKILDTGEILHLYDPQYHGNPIDALGSLVTFDWGYDICQKIFDSSGLFTHVIQIDDLSKGIRAEYIDVLITIKQGISSVRTKF
jgi:SAM-dependent methyltransferase